MFILRLFICISLLSTWACTPQSTDRTADTDDQPPNATDVQNVKCRTFDNTLYRDDALDNYTIYRDRIRQNRFAEALPLWKYVHEKAPDADGKRINVYTDGVKIYSHLYENARTSEQKAAYYDTINMLYEESKRCYDKPKDHINLTATRAFDAYYHFSEQITPEENYKLFIQAFEGYEKDDTPAFLINPFTALMVDRYLADEISTQEAQKWADYVTDVLDRKKKILHPDVWKSEGWDIVADYVPIRLEAFEGTENFYDCAYYIDKYMAEFRAHPDDCDVLQDVYGSLRWGGCEKESAEVQEIWQAMQANNCVRQQAPVATSAGKAYRCLQEGNYKCAVSNFEKAAQETDDNMDKAKYYLLISKIYYAHLKRYSSSRSYALKAANYRSNWGEPYLLIGKLYASSGPLCGSGRGWNSQVVTWAAIDKWQYAKSIDKGVSGEANRLINQYAKYMPSKGDIFQRSLQEGATFRIGCWINETTTIRAAP